MSNDIKVGDVCEIYTTCCEEARTRWLGLECTVVAEFQANQVCVCLSCGDYSYDSVFITGTNVPKMVAGDRTAVPRRFLRKKPPKSDDQDESRTDFTPADPEFSEDLQRRLTKTTETA